VVHELESGRRKIINIKSKDIVYSEHGYDECFEYKDGSCRVPDGEAVGYLTKAFPDDLKASKLVLFDDVVYSSYDHDYWDNYELEHDVDRIVIG